MRNCSPLRGEDHNRELATNHRENFTINNCREGLFLAEKTHTKDKDTIRGLLRDYEIFANLRLKL